MRSDRELVELRKKRMRDNRRVKITANAQLPNDYQTARRLYLSDDRGHVLMESVGLSKFKGRKQKKMSKAEWAERGYEMLGGITNGLNRIVCFMRRDEFVMQVQGGLHDVDLVSDNSSTFMLRLCRAAGLKTYEKRNGGWYVYIPCKSRNRKRHCET